jgi:hypothetical protein
MHENLPPPRRTADTTPTLVGQHGSAWLMDRDMLLKRGRPDDPRHAVTLDQWIAHAPYAHPIWHSYMICSVALRNVPGLPEADIMLPGGTHEVFVIALNPNHDTWVDEAPHMLTPVNFAGQFIEPDDEAANVRIRLTVQDVIDGKLNPDTDFMQWWIRRFSASNIKGDPATAGQTTIGVTQADGTQSTIVIPPVQAPND